MIDSENQAKDQEVETPAKLDNRLIQKLSSLLEMRGVLGERSMGIAFSSSDLKVGFVNSIGQRILKPIFEGGEIAEDFVLGDIVSLVSKRRFDSEVFPLLQVSGTWSGDLVLRDLWGGDIPCRVNFWYGGLKDGLDRRYLFLHGEPLSHSTFKTMRGWKDRELLLALLGHSQDSIYFKDRASRFLRASDRVIKRFGLSYPHEIIGKTDFHFFDAAHATAAYEDEQGIIRTGEPIIDKEEREVWDDQSITWASTTKLPLYDAEGNIVGTFGISRDITAKKAAAAERRDLELRLQLAQRLEAIGSLAAGVAHEINTPTQFVSDNVRFLGDAFSDLEGVLSACMDLVEKCSGIAELETERQAVLSAAGACDLAFLKEEIPQSIEQSLEGLRQTAKIVGSMKEFSYPSSLEMCKSDINHAIENTLNISRSEWKGVAELDLDLDPDLPEVSCMVDQINQVVLNLIVNAAQAIEATESRRGRIGVSTRVQGPDVCIEVSDTGSGMPEEVRTRVFEPFFTTKEVGKGTGQGLAMARSVVVNTHGGSIDCESEWGRGTRFTVRLPLEAKQR